MTQLKSTCQSNSQSRISLVEYLQLISETKQIDAEKEVELIRSIGERDTDASEELIKSNLGLVISIAKQYQNMGLSLCDLILEGNLGLLSAVERLVPSKNFNFAAYATGWIRQSILQALTEHFWMSNLKSKKSGYEGQINVVLHQLNKNFLSKPIIHEHLEEPEILTPIGATTSTRRSVSRRMNSIHVL